MQKKPTFVLKLAAIAAAVSMQGLALAQPTTPAPAAPTVEQAPSVKQDGPRKGHSHRYYKPAHGHHAHVHAAMFVPGYGFLSQKSVAELKLNDEQKKLLQEAQDARKAQRSERIAALKEKRQKRVEALKAGQLDPRAALKDAEAAHKAAAEQHEKIAEKWLAVWDALDKDQQKLVARQFAQKADKRAEFMKKRAERRAAKQDQATGDTPAQKAADAPASQS